MTDPPREEATEGAHFEYFMVRVRVDASNEVTSPAGVVERLGTGRKRVFSDGDELLHLIADWSHALVKLQGEERRSNG